MTLSERLRVSPKKLATEIFEKGFVIIKEETDRLLLLPLEVKQAIEKHPRASHLGLARRFNKSPRLVKKYRLALLARHLKNHFAEDSDAVLGKKFGLTESDVRVKRYELRLYYEHGRGNAGEKGENDASFKQLGKKKDIFYELTKGGKYITDIIRDRGLMFTRSRGQQIVAHHDFGDIRSQRTVLWYAHRLVELKNKELANKLAIKKWVKEQLIASGSTLALASKLGIESENLKRYLRDRLCVSPSFIYSCSPSPMQKFHCAFCGDLFFVPKSLLVHQTKKNKLPKKRFCRVKCKRQYTRIHWAEWFGRKRSKKIALFSH